MSSHPCKTQIPTRSYYLLAIRAHQHKKCSCNECATSSKYYCLHAFLLVRSVEFLSFRIQIVCTACHSRHPNGIIYYHSLIPSPLNVLLWPGFLYHWDLSIANGLAHLPTLRESGTFIEQVGLGPMAETGQTGLYAADEVPQREGRRMENKRPETQCSSNSSTHVRALERTLRQSKTHLWNSRRNRIPPVSKAKPGYVGLGSARLAWARLG